MADMLSRARFDDEDDMVSEDEEVLRGLLRDGLRNGRKGEHSGA